MSKVRKSAGDLVSSTSGGDAARNPATQASSARTDSQQALGPLCFSDAALIISRDPVLTFIATTKTKRGRWLGRDYFSPAIDEGQDGSLVGLDAMAQLLGYLATKDPSGYRFLVREILIGAGKKAHFGGTAVQKAALSFMGAAADLLEFSIKRADWKKYLADSIQAKRKDLQFIEDLVAERRQEFVRRMAAGKEAKLQAAALLRALETSSSATARGAPLSVQTPAGVQQ